MVKEDKYSISLLSALIFIALALLVGSLFGVIANEKGSAGMVAVTPITTCVYKTDDFYLHGDCDLIEDLLEINKRYAELDEYTWQIENKEIQVSKESCRDFCFDILDDFIDNRLH